MNEAERTDTVIRMMFGVPDRRGAGPEPSPRTGDLLGTQAAPWQYRGSQQPGPLSVRSVATAPDFAETPLHEVSFELWAGEIFGIAGVGPAMARNTSRKCFAGSVPRGKGESSWPVRYITRGRCPSVGNADPLRPDDSSAKAP